MGFLHWLPCCGPRRSEPESNEAAADESATLLPPGRDPSIISENYGAADNLPAGQETLSVEQKKRIETIGREAGSQMLSIHRSAQRNPSGRSTASHPSQPYAHARPSRSTSGPGLPKTDTITSTTSTFPSSSAGSSRASSPSPIRERGARMGLSSVDKGQDPKEEDGDRADEVEQLNNEEGKKGEEEVVTKQVFMGNVGGGSGRGKGRGRGRGRGRGKSKGK